MTSPAGRITLAYLALGAAWVVGSDWALGLLGVVDSDAVHTIEGIVFVGLSAALVYGLGAREMRNRQRAEEERERTERQLAAAARFESIGRLTGGIAHDFNNLITAITGNLESFLERERPGGRETEAAELEEARRSADRAAHLTRQLLAFGRRQLLHPERIDLNAVLRDTSSLIGRLIGDGIEVTADLGQDLGPVHVDPGRLEQVVMNLAINARDAMPDGGELHLRTSQVHVDERQARRFPFPFAPGDYVRLDVQDHGVGMDADTQARIFEPFFTTKPKDVGTGLGLATVYGIVKQSGGYIDVTSTPGNGATFSLFFPVAEPASTEDAPRPAGPGEQPDSGGPEPGAARVGSPGETVHPASGTVLVVEDDPGVRSVVLRVLQRRGFDVLGAPDGEEALELLQGASGHVDLLISDIVMPGMGGRELAETVHARYPGLPVLLISGQPGTDLAGADPFLAKPFTPAQLARRVREVLDG